MESSLCEADEHNQLGRARGRGGWSEDCLHRGGQGGSLAERPEGILRLDSFGVTE